MVIKKTKPNNQKPSNKKQIVKKSAKGVLIGTLIGVITGGIAGLLLAPKSGKELRADLVRHFDEIKKKLILELEKAEDFSKKTYAEIVQKVTAAYEHSKKINGEEALNIRKILESHYNEIKQKIKSRKTKK
jgi:gas vesicle protein